MTVAEFRERLTLLGIDETRRRYYTFSIHQPRATEDLVLEFIKHPEREAQLAHIFDLPTEAEKTAQGTQLAATAAMISASAARYSAIVALISLIVSVVVSVVSLWLSVRK